MRLLPVFLCFILTVRADAACVITKEQQVANYPNGACVCASLETVGNYLGYTETCGITATYAATGWPWGMSQAAADLLLVSLGVPHHEIVTLAELREVADSGQPAVINFRRDSSLGAHACVMVDVTDTHVYFVDCNHVGDVYRFEIADFLTQWDGGCALE